ncbi:MAG: hypothetical protein RL180_1688 [Pseudomonadota bacterium]
MPTIQKETSLNRVLITSIVLSGIMATTARAADPTIPSRMVEPTKLAIDRHGVKVWTYQTVGNPAFNYRATTILDSNVTGVVAAIQDTSYLNKWVPYLRTIDTLENTNAAGMFVLRMELDFPFPLQDREVVVSGSMKQAADGTVTMINKAVSDPRAPIQSRLLRVEHYEGSWLIRPISKNRTEVTTTGYADPAGLLPLPIVNMFVQQQPYQMLRNMQTIVRSPRYQNAKVKAVKNPF